MRHGRLIGENWTEGRTKENYPLRTLADSRRTVKDLSGRRLDRNDRLNFEMRAGTTII
jgi:hypothetical protein